MNQSHSLLEIAQQAREAAGYLAGLDGTGRRRALEEVARALEAAAPDIVAANRADLAAAQGEGISKALYARLKLDEAKLQAEIAGVRSVGRLPDPVGRVEIRRELDTDLVLRKVTCPVGVLGIIFESRPDAAIQISALAIMSGNGAILKGGRESEQSCRAIIQAVQMGLVAAGVSPAAVQLLTTREEIAELLGLDAYVDLIIPRGSNSFVRYVRENTRIPVLGHADGLCHLYVDRAADVERAVRLAVDSKVQYPAACNAIETLLVHGEIAAGFLPAATAALRAAGVTLRVDEVSRQILEQATGEAGGEDANAVDAARAAGAGAHAVQGVEDATDADWSAEYLDLTLAVKVVDSLEEAIAHINRYGSRHTDAIATEDPAAAAEFLSRVDSAGVYHNASTRFADGFRYGFGAEVGISTQKMPPRGPVGLDGLVTYKYLISGSGQVVADYSGPNARPFTHKDL